MKRFLSLSTALVLALAAQAATTPVINVSWVNPTSYSDCTDSACTNGTPLPATDILQTRIEYGTCVGASPVLFGTKQGQFIAAGAATQATSPSLAPGVYCVRVYTAAKTLTNESLPSNVVQVTLGTPPIPAPAPPSNLKVTAGIMTAFDPIKSKDNLALLPVGTVAAGTACDTTQGVVKSGLTYFVVPLASVTLTGSIKPIAVVAQCS